MNTFLALAVVQLEHQAKMRQMENEQFIRQALTASRQKTETTQSIWKLWRQLMASILPG